MPKTKLFYYERVVSFKGIGRLGNFMFQTAAIIGYSKLHGIDFTVPEKSLDPKIWPVYFPHLRKQLDTSLPVIEITEPCPPHYQPIPFYEDWRNKNIILSGFWQSEKYFTHCFEDVKNAFGFQELPQNDYVSIHVRRGDYVRYAHLWPPVTLKYLYEAIGHFYGLGFKKFLCFSDDLRWCRLNISMRKFPGATIEFSRGRNEIQDLELMASCSHNIASNSSYSWWGSYLNKNPNKMVCVPKVWFGPANQHINSPDLVPKEWVII